MPKMSIFYHRFVECAQKWPENVALEIQTRDSLESYTYAEVRSLSESLAHWLISSGYAPGTRCAILATNHPRWVTTYLGIIAAGCIAVPLDTASDAHQVATLLNDSGASLLFSDSQHLRVAQQAVEVSAQGAIAASESRLQTKPTGRVAHSPLVASSPAVLDSYQTWPSAPPDLRATCLRPEDLAALLYTSGTTADPKGVMLTHANLMGEAEAVFGWVQIGPGDALLGVLPLFHALAQMANLLLPLVSGSRV